MSEGFVHSVRVPRLYKTVADVVKEVIENGASLKPTIYQKKHPNVPAIFALGYTTLQRATELNTILLKTQLLFKEKRMNPWLARVLITELFWGKKSLKGDAKPIQTILSYESELREALNALEPIMTNLNAPKKVKPRYVRVNTLLMTVNEAIQEFENEGYTILSRCCNYQSFLVSLGCLTKWTFIQDFHIPELFAFAPGVLFHNHEGYRSGAIVLQDKASCLPAFLLDPKPGSVVLDMCAAPGMKTTHLASIMQDNGKIYSVEMNKRRYELLCQFIESAQATCITAINRDAMTLTPSDCPDVEYILVDPSCSGSGMDRPEFDNFNGKCAPLRLKSLQSFQVMLLRHALFKFPTVKRVVYSTCSIYPEENEMVIDEILEDIGEAYQLIPGKKLLSKGWHNFSSLDYKCKDNCVYARTDVDMSNGFFVAVFERNFNVPLPEYNRTKYIKDQGNSCARNNFNNNGDNNASAEIDDNFQGTVEQLNENDNEQAQGKKKKLKSDIDNCTVNEPIDEVPLIKKKKKKTKVINDEQLNTDNIEINNTTIDEPTEKKKKKKKRKKSPCISAEVEEDITSTVDIINSSDIEGETKKKNKKKRKN